jgi:cytochrome c-type biogenesis protein CcmH/NrfG
MKRALAILVGTVLVCLVAYLSWLNPTTAQFRVTPARTVEAPLAALMAFAFIVGALMVLAVVMIQAGRRAFATWLHGREQRRIERVDEWETRGEDLVWNGRVQHGRALLHKAWQRRPESPHAVLALAASHRDTAEVHRARELLATAAERHHTHPDVLFALAEAHRAAGDRAACIETLERLRALRPHAPRVLRALREQYVHAQRWHDATVLQEALLGEMRDSANQATHEREYLTALRYQASIGLSDPGARIRALEALADTRTDSLPVLVILGDALLAGSRADEARNSGTATACAPCSANYALTRCGPTTSGCSRRNCIWQTGTRTKRHVNWRHSRIRQAPPPCSIVCGVMCTGGAGTSSRPSSPTREPAPHRRPIAAASANGLQASGQGTAHNAVDGTRIGPKLKLVCANASVFNAAGTAQRRAQRTAPLPPQPPCDTESCTRLAGRV